MTPKTQHKDAKALPQRIFFDAGGTLFTVRGSVGAVYARIAARHGWTLAPEMIERGFKQAFGAQPPLAFAPTLTPETLQRVEIDWWRTLVAQVLPECATDEARFADFFTELYETFRHAEAWEVYPDVIPTLTALRARGIALAVLSNFDTRLDELLVACGLAGYFDAVHLSVRLGAAKPAAEIFQAALRYHNLLPQQAWHVGDAWREDIAGATACELRACWIERTGAAPQPALINAEERAIRITALTDLLTLPG